MNANFTIGDPIVLTGAPLVKVSSTDPSASEGGSNSNGRLATPGGRRAATDPGFIQFERSSGEGTMVVNYTIEGTATNGVDFATLPTSIMFAEGQTVVMEELNPLEDDLVENDESIIITLLDSDSYDPDPNNLTTAVTIKDRVTTSFAITGVSTVSCEPVVGSATRRTLTFAPQYSGLSGQPVSFSVVNEMLPTTTPGPYTLGMYIDKPTITLKATQAGTNGETSFSYNWLAACSTNAKMAKEIGSESTMAARVLGNPIIDGRVDVEVTGAAGQPLQLYITNTWGMVVSSHRIEQAGLVETYTFSIGQQSVGTLLLRVVTLTQAKTITLIKVQ